MDYYISNWADMLVVREYDFLYFDSENVHFSTSKEELYVFICDFVAEINYCLGAELIRHKNYFILEEDFDNAEEIQKLIKNPETEDIAFFLVRNQLNQILDKNVPN